MHSPIAPRDRIPSEAEEGVGQVTPLVDESEDNSAEVFEAVLAQLQREQIAPVVQSVRQRHFPDDKPSDVEILEAIYGSFHVLFPVQFSGGKRWLLKIPSHGRKDTWNELSAQTLVAEATTMRSLKVKTTIPVPQVFDFSATIDNALGCPYILLDYLDGVPLYDVWFANRLKGVDDKVVHQHRIKALQGIASAMSQLSAYPFTKAGSPLIDSSDKLADVSSLRFMDHHSMLDRWFDHQDPSNEPIFLPIEPFSDPRQYYTFPLDLRAEDPDGLVCLLRQLVQWLPEPPAEEPFVLAHPDFDIQNFLVTEEGELCGIIDWDGVCTVPRSVGNLCLPGWLTRDWDPGMYGYEESMEDGEEPVGVWENSPKELARYRQIYRGFAAAGMPQGSPETDKADVTSMSLIAQNLCIAARDPACRGGILEKLLQEIGRAGNGGCNKSAGDFAWELKERQVEPSVLATLRAGFEAVLGESHGL